MKKVFVFLALATFCLLGRAQSALDKTDFEAPKHLVAAKGKTANVRERPNLKAPLVARWFDADEKEILRLNAGTLCEVLGEENGWYKVRFPCYLYEAGPGTEVGYVSKTVVSESPITPMEYINPGFMKYDGDLFEYITATKSERFPYLYVTGCLSYCDEPNNYAFKETSHQVVLWLGKRVGDLLVFKYPTCVTIVMKPNYTDGDRYNAESHTLTFGSAVDGGLGWYPFDKETGMLHFDFDNYGDGALELIFGQSIEAYNEVYSMSDKDEADQIPTLYITAERLKQGW